MPNGNFNGYIKSPIRIRSAISENAGGYHNKSPDKVQKNSDSTKLNFKHVDRGDVEEWKSKGAFLYKLSNGFYGDGRVIPSERSDGGVVIISEKGEHHDQSDVGVIVNKVTGDESFLKCFSGVNAKFWGDGSTGFCSYYEKDDSGKYSICLAVVTTNEAFMIKVSDAVFEESQVKRSPPICVSHVKGGVHRVVFPFLIQKEKTQGIEADTELSSLHVYQYSILERNNNVTVRKLGNALSSNTRSGFSGPLGVTVNSDGDIIVVGKFKDRIRLSSSDTGYFAWKFSGKDLSLLKPRGLHNHRGVYLFRRFGGSAYRNAERIVIWESQKDNQLFLTHVDKYLLYENSEYYTAYTARNIDVEYREDSAEKCLIKSFRCSMAGPKVSVLRNKKMHLMANMLVDGTRYIFYMSTTGEKREASGSVDMLMFKGDNYVVIEGIIDTRFSVSSMNTRLIDGNRIGILLTERGKERAHMYEIPSGDELLKTGATVKASVIDCNNMGRQEFINTVSGGSPIRGTAETTTDVEISITKGNFMDFKYGSVSRGYVKVVKYVRGHEKSGQSLAEASTEKGAQAVVHTSGNGASGKKSHSSGSTVAHVTSSTELPDRKDSQAAVHTSGNGASGKKSHSSGSTVAHVTSSTELPDRKDSQAAVHTSGGVEEERFSSTFPTVMNSTGASIVGMKVKSQEGMESSATTRRPTNSSAFYESSHCKVESNSSAWIMSGLIAAFCIVAAGISVCVMILRNRRRESNLYRNMYYNAVEEDISLMRLESRGASVHDSIPSACVMESISESLSGNNCKSVHEL